ncbi:DUF4132 domain-containing protein [Kitasatospora sp. NPDC089797]|uniref:DUF4132 domain-containing protein n=1 Tax=Kitasatospora sp. NPDC089797 TaxID=3155298 RepID=UPI0034330382
MQFHGIMDRLRRRTLAPADLAGIADGLVELAAFDEDTWSGVRDTVLDAVGRKPAETRGALADALGARLPAAEPGPARGNVLALAVVIERTLPDRPGSWPAEREAVLGEVGRQHGLWFGERYLVLAEAELAEGRPLAPAVVAAFRRSAMDAFGGDRVRALGRQLTEPVLNVGEAWAERAMREAEDGPALEALLRHATTATAARPGRAWERQAGALVEQLGADRVRAVVVPWLALVGRRTFELERRPGEPDVNAAFDPYNADALRGLTWVLGMLPAQPDTVRALGALVESSLRKASGIGPRSPKAANAAVGALTRLGGEPVLAELARLATRVTYKPVLALVESVLEHQAAELGLSREELAELTVPDCGLTEVGRTERHLGDVTAVVEVRGVKAVLSWRSPAGKSVKSVPAAVRREHAEELKELKAAVKDADRTLSAQSERLDRQFLADRAWPYARWRRQLLDHPLVGTLARRLLWTVDGTAVGFADGELRTLTDDPVREGGEVRLWHPVGCPPAVATAWRDWLERHAITQPFKQAHREVYLLTDAERATRTYSNRFAGHVLRQHQFNALAAVRGWRNRLRLMVDDSAPPATRELPRWGLRAEYWVHGDGHAHGADTTDSGSFLRLRTDQVRFYPIDAPPNLAACYGGDYGRWPSGGAAPAEPVPLADVPPLALSEVLRDVDLFVGVASIGNDPTWQDGGPEGRHRAYWNAYGSGELSQSAETRRALLERLVPRLAIADRCRIEGRYLQVTGSRHTYRIHLGSGNVLMTPDDRYLCIVPAADPAAPQAGYLPFEGDRMTAVILSKAVLLADDARITDPSILSQLEGVGPG